MAVPEVNAQDTNGMRWRLLGLIPLLLVAGFYFSYLYEHGINVPLADDIYDVLQPLTQASSAENAKIALQSLYVKHTDHRTITSRLAYGAVYLATGEVNFHTLNFLANLALLLLLLALYWMSAGTPRRLLVLLPAALLLLQLRAYGITFWAMASFAYFYVFAYGFFCLLLLHDAGRGRFLAALVLATLASFTLASGQMIWLVGLASLAQQSLVRRSLPRRYLLYWLLSAITVLLLWRMGQDDRISAGLLLESFFGAAGHYVLYTLTLLGSAVSETSVAAAATAGALMLVILCACTLWRWREADLRVELCRWFIVLSVMTMVLGRGFSTVDYGLSSRYSFPSVLMLTSTWMLLALRLRLSSWPKLLPAIVMALLFNAHSYRTYSLALQPYMERRAEDFNLGRYRAWPFPLKQSNRVVAEAIELGIYFPPPRPLPPASVAFGQLGQVDAAQ